MGTMRESQVRLTRAIVCNEADRSSEDRGASQSLMSMREMSSGGIHGERGSDATGETASWVDTDICVVMLRNEGIGSDGRGVVGVIYYMGCPSLCKMRESVDVADVADNAGPASSAAGASPKSNRIVISNRICGSYVSIRHTKKPLAYSNIGSIEPGLNPSCARRRQSISPSSSNFLDEIFCAHWSPTAESLSYSDSDLTKGGRLDPKEKLPHFLPEPTAVSPEKTLKCTGPLRWRAWSTKSAYFFAASVLTTAMSMISERAI